MREKKIKLKLDKYEFDLIIRALNDLRTQQLKKGGTTDPINEFGVRIDIWTHFMRGCIIDYVH